MFDEGEGERATNTRPPAEKVNQKKMTDEEWHSADSESDASSLPTFECQVCWENMPLLPLSCGHMYCAECLSRHSLGLLEEDEITNLTCFDPVRVLFVCFVVFI